MTSLTLSCRHYYYLCTHGLQVGVYDVTTTPMTSLTLSWRHYYYLCTYGLQVGVYDVTTTPMTSLTLSWRHYYYLCTYGLQVGVWIDCSKRGDLIVMLRSPSQTYSTLLTARSRDNSRFFFFFCDKWTEAGRILCLPLPVSLIVKC